ncbi:MAG: TetR/AcrR family transcriptional regulator [Actinomycetaceae bacterium]|nr:TetR/AcrR family transcriptional regulator [Actinomycetaceae bacterium]
MRVIKKREVRRGEILDVAEYLFNENGFDATSTSQIIEKAGIARGTLYHHFPSKGAIVDALVERLNTRILSATKAIEQDTSLSALERLIATVQALNVDSHGGGQLREHIHKPGNALMHQKIQESIVANVTPVLAAIVEDGIREGTFSTPYPYEATEMIVVYANEALDANALSQLEPEQVERRVRALVYNVGRLLGDETGALAPQLARLFANPDDADTRTTSDAAATHSSEEADR